MSNSKKKKLQNSFQTPGGGKHKGKGVKRLSFYTSSQRLEHKKIS